MRYSHPNVWKIGKHVSTDFGPVLSGREYVGVQTGSLGKSVRAKVPLRANGRIIGFVSVGLLERKVSAQLQADLPVILIPPAIGLLLGIAGGVGIDRFDGLQVIVHGRSLRFALATSGERET